MEKCISREIQKYSCLLLTQHLVNSYGFKWSNVKNIACNLKFFKGSVTRSSITTTL